MRAIVLFLCLATGCDSTPPTHTYADGSRVEGTPHPMESNRYVGVVRTFRPDGSLKEESEYDHDGVLQWSNYYADDGVTVTGRGRQ